MNDEHLNSIIEGTWRQRYTILVPVILLPVIGYIIGNYTPKLYKAHTSMLIQETAKMNPFLEDLAVSAMLKERMDALRTLLHSRHILGAVALEMGFINEQSSTQERDQKIARLSNSLNVTMAGKDLIRIDYKSDTPVDIKETLESVSIHFVEQLLAPERSSMKDSASFLYEHLNNRRKELEKAEETLARYKKMHGSGIPEYHKNNLAELSKMRQLLSEKKAELAGATKSLQGIDQQLSQINPVLRGIEDNIVNAKSLLSVLKSKYTMKHSKVQSLIRQLDRLEKERQAVITESENDLNKNRVWDLLTHTDEKKSDLGQLLLISQLELLQKEQSRHLRLTEEVKRIDEHVNMITEKTSQYDEHEREYMKLKRDLDVKRRLYEELLHRYEMARVTGSLGQFEQTKRVK